MLLHIFSASAAAASGLDSAQALVLVSVGAGVAGGIPGGGIRGGGGNPLRGGPGLRLHPRLSAYNSSYNNPSSSYSRDREAGGLMFYAERL
jgi:hypothetical protein